MYTMVFFSSGAVPGNPPDRGIVGRFAAICSGIDGPEPRYGHGQIAFGSTGSRLRIDATGDAACSGLPDPDQAGAPGKAGSNRLEQNQVAGHDPSVIPCIAQGQGD